MSEFNMPNIFSFIIKQKRVVFLALLFFVMAGFILPTVTLAANVNTQNAPGEGGNFQDLNNVSGSFLFNAPRFIILSLSYLGSLIIFKITEYSTSLFDYTLTTLTRDDKWAITRDTYINSAGASVPTAAGGAFLSAWSLVKNWANMLIVLGLIGIAIATILRFRDYEAKKLLIPIIIIAILINFSVVFCGIVIDASNVIMRDFASGGDQESSLFLKVNASWDATVYPLPLNTLPQALAYVGLSAVYWVIYIVVALSLLFMSITLVERYIWLAILFIASPLAFVFYAFPLPAAKGIWTQWWHYFIKWSFVGLGGTFILKLSTDILGAFTWAQPVAGPAAEAGIVPLIFQLIIVIGFLVTGLGLIRKASGPVANGVIGAAKSATMGVSVAGLALAGGVAGGALKVSGVSGVAERAGSSIKNTFSDWSMATRERLGFAPMGTANEMKTRREAQSMKRYDELAGKLTVGESEQIAKQWNTGLRIKGGETKRQEVANLKKLLESGNGFMIGDTQEQIKAAKYVESYYGPATSEANRNLWSKLKSKNADTAVGDEVAINEAKRKLVGRNNGNINPFTRLPYNTPYTEDDIANENAHSFHEMQMDAEKAVIRDSFAKMDDSDLKKMSNQDVAAAAKEESSKGALALEEAIKRKILGMVGSFDETAKLIQNSEKYGSSAINDAKKVNPKYAEYDTKAIHEKMYNADGTPTGIDETKAKEQVKIDAYKKLNAGSIRTDLAETAFDIDLVKNVSYQKISDANKGEGLSAKKIEKLKALEPVILGRILAAYADDNDAEATEWGKKLKVIKVLS